MQAKVGGKHCKKQHGRGTKTGVLQWLRGRRHQPGAAAALGASPGEPDGADPKGQEQERQPQRGQAPGSAPVRNLSRVT